MTRPLFNEYPGTVYHTTSRGNAQGNIFRDDHDRELFTEILVMMVKRHHWLVHAFCLMDNHYHLLVETPDANLSKGMQELSASLPKDTTESITNRDTSSREDTRLSNVTQKQARNEKVYDTHLKQGYTLKEIADSLGLHYSTVSKMVQRMEEKK